jgi:beta-barrel assembly-enhancing protease
MPVRRIAFFVVLALAAPGVYAQRKPGAPLKPGFNLFSKQQDIQLGEESAKQVLQQYQVVQNPFLAGYLKRVGERLAATQVARESQFPFTFTTLNVGELNAFALPGGPMFIFTGLLKAVDNEAQLAGVMGHEMAHVILRHGTNQVSKANLIQIPAALAGATAGKGSMLGQLATLGVGLGANSVLLKFSRDAESQADAMGARMLNEAGYNPLEMARFFEKLESGGGSTGKLSQFFSDHPNPGNREKAIEAEIQVMGQRSYTDGTGDFQRARTEVGKLPAPPKQAAAPAAAQGAPASAPSSGPAPTPQIAVPSSSGWKQSRGQKFTISYPAGWQTFIDQQSTTIAPAQGLVQAGGATQVGYGAILNYGASTQGADLKTATNNLVNQLRSENASMKVTSKSPQSTRIGNSNALITMLESTSPYGGAETDALITVSRPEGLFYMVLVAPKANYAQLQGTFQQMLNSLQFQN